LNNANYSSHHDQESILEINYKWVPIFCD